MGTWEHSAILEGNKDPNLGDPQGGALARLQVTGIIEGFFGVCNFRFCDFLG